VFPVDEFVRDELYPGYKQAFGSQPYVADPVRPFGKADNAGYWLRDSLHFSEGMVPASIAFLDDAQTWGAQLAAEIVGVPPTRGSVNRLAATHVYIGTIDVDTDWQIQARAARFASYVEPILADFDRYWGMRAAELQSAYDHFDALDLTAMDPGQLWTALKDAYAFHRRAWFIHFEVMYVLTANYLAFYSLAEEIGLEGSLVSALLSGRPTFYSETDEEPWRLAGRARELEVSAPLLYAAPADALSQIAARPNGEAWLTDFRSFLKIYGQRTEETCRVDTPSWEEDPGTRPVRDRIVPVQARVRLRHHPAGRRRRAGRTDRGGSPRRQRRQPQAVQRGPGRQPGRQLRLVERGAQLPYRPARRDPRPPRQPGTGRAARGRRPDQPARRPVLPVQARAVRRDGRQHRALAGPGRLDPRQAGVFRGVAAARPGVAHHARDNSRHGAGPDHDRGVRPVRALSRHPQGRIQRR
jgi:hypothetical protein